ncbi:MAG: DUF2911 domain-containing protein [Saprospiraceae bacterium]
MKNSNFLSLLLLTFLVLGTASQVNAQEDKSQRPSPPATATITTNDLAITIDYSSPAVKGRQVLGNLIPNGKIWRLGANEATTFNVSKDVLVEGQILHAGKYSLFSIQDGGDWTFIFNKVADQWGAYNYDQSKDAIRVTVTPGKSSEMVERMTFNIKETKKGAADVVFNWENIEVKFHVLQAL